MKFDELKSIGHNIAASLASGVSMLVEDNGSDIFEEAAASPEGQVTVDFLTGTTKGGATSPELARMIQKLPDGLATLCKRHGCTTSEFKILSARYGTDSGQGPYFAVTVTSGDGRSSVDQYIGVSGQRPRHLTR